MTSEELIRRAERLAPAEKLELICGLWDTIPIDQWPAPSDSALAEVRRRSAEYAAGGEDSVPMTGIRPSRGWRNMSNESSQMPVNPYESPHATNERTHPPANTLWVGPLLSASVLLFCSSIVFSAVTVVDEVRWLQYTISTVITLASLICLGTSFWLYRRAKRELAT